MAACQLKLQGVEPIIIEKNNGPTNESRALVVHARTMEIYDQLGIANESLLQGAIVQKVQFVIANKKVQQVPFGNIGEGLSPFPFILVLEQSKNEALLYRKLQDEGGAVSWGTELLSIQEEEAGVRAVVRRGEETFDIVADYVIAADGAKSPTRHALDVPFNGDTYEQIFFVADTKVESQWGKDELTIYLSTETFLALFPMQGENRFRVIGILPKEYQNETPQSFEDIVPLIQKQLAMPVNFSDTSWFSVYRLQHRCIENFRMGKIFFAGDAAHVHSPAGGQGMNSGLQDAYNLAWKLALVVKGQAGEKLLETYNQERLPFAQNLISSTDRVFSMATSSRWYHKLLRLQIVPRIMPLLLRIKKYRLKAFRTVSQIGVKYINSDLTVNRTMDILTVKAGERFPYLRTADGESLYDRLREPVFYALYFSVKEGSNLATELGIQADEMPDLLSVIDLSEEKEIITTLKIKTDTIILLRPDHYIGLITDEGAKVAGDYLRRLGEHTHGTQIKLPLTHV